MCLAVLVMTPLFSAMGGSGPPPTTVQTRFSVTYPFTTVVSNVFSDISAFTLPANKNFSVWFASGTTTAATTTPVFQNGAISPQLIVGFPSSPVQTLAITVPSTATFMVIVTSDLATCITFCGTTPNVTSVVDTLGSVFTKRVSNNGTIPFFTANKIREDIWTASLVASGSDTITVHWNPNPVNIGDGNVNTHNLRMDITTYSNIANIGTQLIHQQTGGASISNTLALTSSNSLLLSSLQIDAGGSHTSYSVGSGQAIRETSAPFNNFVNDLATDDKQFSAQSTVTVTGIFNRTLGGGVPMVYESLELIGGTGIFLQVVNTTDNTIIYQLDLISQVFRGDPQALVALASVKYASNKILTFRITNGSSLNVTLSGVVIVSIV
jgi:hypothetical protein